MKADIKQIDERTCTVNGKRMFKNMDGYWVESGEELTPNEQKQFHDYMYSLELQNRLN